MHWTTWISYSDCSSQYLIMSAGSIYSQWELQECYEHVTIWSGGALALCVKRYVCLFFFFFFGWLVRYVCLLIRSKCIFCFVSTHTQIQMSWCHNLRLEKIGDLLFFIRADKIEMCVTWRIVLMDVLCQILLPF